MGTTSSANAPRRRTIAALVAIGAAILFSLLASFGTPANADYNHPCLPAQSSVPVYDLSPYATGQVFVASDTSPDGQVGVCVRPVGGSVVGVPYLVGVGVGGNLVGGDASMTGVLVQPQACAQVYPGGVDTCVTEGTTGAEASTSGSARVCVEQICQRIG